MVVKILSSAGSFSGVEYNENKVSAGTAELMAAENFGLLELNGGAGGRAIHEYQQFFKAWSTNERGMIEKPQFHAVISCEGRTYSGTELKDFAEQYLDRMGYKNNPYLIYFHKDTANNHVHLVSSRVDESGLKINDSFERVRSQVVMKEILGQNAGQEVSQQVKRALAYNFSSEAQFKMILEGQGITVKPQDNQYQFIRAGRVVYEIKNDLVANKIKNYQEPGERTQQLKALFSKYKPALTPEKFSAFMKDKFGVEVVFHTAKGKAMPYGYSILDHAQGQVLKGSQVMPLAALLAAASREDQLQAGGELISTMVEIRSLRYREFKSALAKLGFDLATSGQVKITGEEKISFSIARERIQQALYQDRLYEAQKFAIHSPAEAEIIRRLLFLKIEDAAWLGSRTPAADRDQNRIMMADKLNSLLATGKNLGDIASENNYVFAKQGEAVFLIDKQRQVLYPWAELTDSKLDYRAVDMIDADRISRPEYRQLGEYSQGTLEEVLGLVLNSMAAPADEQEPANQRKRKRNQ
ncbi:relaxase/mobilization nuclease domain-containing protein [Adhaeribacter rhizoryzae]|uniref:Relaxase/mobilization nuclease domain-containing protein n=1 Tax=Adhaeribacter rhizoryzae TaxID=2607907 RepID=A0A5M6CV78_9BACT|nr:relaxase/mobilization nuclease domain-containing protein [Adhaeribacter rhizoryzae]KAA5539134.1 relaxase/mobilization nuclease domain-containing protein [Adhaeribacter rhizoryzae]